MNWLAFAIFCLGIMGVLVGTNETANPPDPRQSPPQPEEDGTVFSAGHHHFSLLKGEGLEIEKCQMN